MTKRDVIQEAVAAVGIVAIIILYVYFISHIG